MTYIFIALTINIYGLICYFFQENFTGSITLNGCLLLTAGTGFIEKGFSRRQRHLGGVETFQNFILPANLLTLYNLKSYFCYTAGVFSYKGG